MKKFVVLALVLGMVSMASAGLCWTVADGATNIVANGDGSFTVTAGHALTLALKVSGTTNDDKVNAVKVDLITDGGATGMITGVATVATWSENGDDGMDAAAWDALGAFYEMPGFPMGLAAGDWAALDRFGTGDALMNVTLLTISYTMGNASTTIYGQGIAFLESNNYVALASGFVPMPELVLNIPEPMTMLLLGLGGLFLRKR